MSGVTLQLTQESERKLNRLVREMQEATGREAKTVLRNVGRDLCYAAIKRTPGTTPAKSPRWIWHGKGDNAVYVPRKKKGGGIARVSSPGGLAKAGWSGILTRLGKPGRGGAQSEQWSEAFYRGDKKNLSLTLANTCPFIERFDKGKNPSRRPLHILENSLQAVLMSTEKRLENMARRVKRDLGL